MTALALPGDGMAHPASVADPPKAQAMRLPAGFDVSNTLSEDTIVAEGMQTPPGRNQVALFANPFADESEEMLYINEALALMWVRHTNSGSIGWELVDTGFTATEVVIAVHPTGDVFAIVLVDSTEIATYVLRDNGDGPSWVEAKFNSPVFSQAKNLSVQYLPNRPADAFVFVTDQAPNGPSSVTVLESEIAAEGQTPLTEAFWQPRLQLPVESAVWAAADNVVCAMDGPTDDPTDLTIWTLREGGIFHEWVIPRNGPPRQLQLARGVDALAGLFQTPRGVGCVGLAKATDTSRPLILTRCRSNDSTGLLERQEVDRFLENATVWQDVNGLMHLFGLDSGALHVVHQVGVFRRHPLQALVPAWDTVRAADRTMVAVARPLIADVADFALDTYPDEYPSQHVMHNEKVAGSERCAVYSQDVESTWWSREVVRLPTVAKPYPISRYKTLVTLVDSMGGPVPDYAVTLTADRLVDVEILGKFYRIGPSKPASLTTNAFGEISLKVVARSLAGTALHLSAKGVSQSATVNAATETHNFLAGTGTLPNHSAGLTADGLHDAKTPDGEHVFPAWHRADHGLAAVPTAENVLEWCHTVFSGANAGVTRVRGDDGVLRELQMISMQTWDADRDAYEVITDETRAAELLALRRAHPRYAGVLDSGSSWFGDLWQGIEDGLVQVVDTVIDYAGQAASIFISWVDGLVIELNLLWDDIAGAIQFVQSVFNMLLAKIQSVIDWLKWLLDLTAVMNTKRAFEDALRQLPAVVSKQAQVLLLEIGPSWFAEQEAKVVKYLDDAKQALQGVTFSGDQSPPAGTPGPSSDVPAIAYDKNKQKNPHATWMTDQLGAAPTGTRFGVAPHGQDVPPEAERAYTAITGLFALFDDPGVVGELEEALSHFGELVTNLFNFNDPKALAAAELVSLIELFEALVKAVLNFLQHLLGLAFEGIAAALDCIQLGLDLPLDDGSGFVAFLWEFICETAGIEYSTPTTGDVFLFAAAFLFTVLSKAMTGAEPFPDGKFPDLLAEPQKRADLAWVPDGRFSAPGDYLVPPLVQTLGQILVGIATGLFAGVDWIMDQEHSDDTRDQDLFVIFITVFDLIAFGVGDLPLFWGTNGIEPAGSPERVNSGLWWGEYFSKAPIYFFDFIVAIILPVWYPEYVNPAKGRKFFGQLQGWIGQIFITLFGLTESGISLGLVSTSEGNPVDIYWVFVQLASLTSSNTAIWRNLPGFPEAPSTQAFWKRLIDVSADVLSGITYTLVALLESFTFRSSLTSTELRLPDARVGQPYDSGPIRRQSAMFPPIGFTISQGALPLGLALAQSSEDSAVDVRVVGTMPLWVTPGDYSFTILSVNSYDPNVPNTGEFTITVKA